jgi:hypothetical protein
LGVNRSQRKIFLQPGLDSHFTDLPVLGKARLDAPCPLGSFSDLNISKLEVRFIQARHGYPSTVHVHRGVRAMTFSNFRIRKHRSQILPLRRRHCAVAIPLKTPDTGSGESASTVKKLLLGFLSGL